MLFIVVPLIYTYQAPLEIISGSGSPGETRPSLSHAFRPGKTESGVRFDLALLGVTVG